MFYLIYYCMACAASSPPANLGLYDSKQACELAKQEVSTLSRESDYFKKRLVCTSKSGAK